MIACTLLMYSGAAILAAVAFAIIAALVAVVIAIGTAILGSGRDGGAGPGD